MLPLRHFDEYSLSYLIKILIIFNIQFVSCQVCDSSSDKSNDKMALNFKSWRDMKEEYLSKENQYKNSEYVLNHNFNSKIAIWKGDITLLKVDAIVNAANNELMEGGGVCGSIFRAAGSKLTEACRQLKGCETGSTKLTNGFELPAKYILHTVGPRKEVPELLKSCYITSLNLAVKNNIKTLAFPCISTGIYGYPNRNAANIALRSVREWLEENPNQLDFLIFCVYLDLDESLYYELLHKYFPL